MLNKLRFIEGFVDARPRIASYKFSKARFISRRLRVISE